MSVLTSRLVKLMWMSNLNWQASLVYKHPNACGNEKMCLFNSLTKLLLL